MALLDITTVYVVCGASSLVGAVLFVAPQGQVGREAAAFRSASIAFLIFSVGFLQLLLWPGTPGQAAFAVASASSLYGMMVLGICLRQLAGQRTRLTRVIAGFTVITIVLLGTALFQPDALCLAVGWLRVGVSLGILLGQRPLLVNPASRAERILGYTLVALAVTWTARLALTLGMGVALGAEGKQAPALVVNLFAIFYGVAPIVVASLILSVVSARQALMHAALHSISEAAHSAEDLIGLFRRIHEIVGRLLPARNFFVALYDDEIDLLTFPYYIDEFDQAPSPRKLQEGTLAAQVIRSGRSLLLTPETQKKHAPPGEEIVGSDSLDWLGVPLKSGGRTIGVLTVQTYSGDVRYTHKDKVLLQYVSAQVAATIERKQTAERIFHMAQYDALTNLPNRALFSDRLKLAIAKAKRDRERLALMYLDLDKFKPVNDTHGHAIGDLLLKAAALRISESVRECDTIGRIGGDEFVVLLQGIKLDSDAHAIGEKIRLALDQPFELDGIRLQVSSSIGVAIYPDHGIDQKQLSQHADAAMYRAKNRGGNGLEAAA